MFQRVPEWRLLAEEVAEVIEELATNVLYVLYSSNRCMPGEKVICGIVQKELLGMLNI